MKLAISNIAWEKHDDPEILRFLRDNGVTGIEVAPTKIWKDWENANHRSADTYRWKMAKEGFELAAMQAILFGKPHLQLLLPETHSEFLKHIELVANIASGLEADVLVLGAPKNRRRNQIGVPQANEIAAEFLFKAGKICHELDCCIGLEPNPVEYGCDFINNVADARELVDLVNHPGLQLHLDSAGIYMCGGDLGEIIKSAGEFAHYHISEPMLEPIHGGKVNHSKAFKALGKCGYEGWVSIEMKQPSDKRHFEDSVRYVNQLL